MNKLLLIVAGITAAALLLVGTFVTAAGMMGANLSELPLLGRMFPAPPVAAVDTQVDATGTSIEEKVQADRRSPEQVIDMSASPLQAFLLPTPWTAAELEGLETQLKNRLAAVAEREKQLDERENLLSESQRHLADLQAELENVRTGLIEERDDTSAMQEEVAREQEAAKQRKVAGLRRMSNLFADGDPEDSARMLLEAYSPEEAGIVLSGLGPDRVRDLMQGIHVADPEVLRKIENSYRSNTDK
ncbi:MAG: hypothetical protein H6830_09620 [Planctomycetes bacterium]|nr:hypothetical protein [Planctomycetota bacterium]MCB9909983.1 hypothetical protein [Planctomycetota bacterium]HPF12717.1 hypothetical protein [Planctomycetota bacterium]HRV81809.1 hypothetical protein [Planctomycetota bacterium]